MEQLARILPKLKKFQNYIEDVKKSNFPINLSGLSESAKAHFIYATRFYTQKPIVVITYNEIELNKIKKDLDFFCDENVLTLKSVCESTEEEYARRAEYVISCDKETQGTKITVKTGEYELVITINFIVTEDASADESLSV